MKNDGTYIRYRYPYAEIDGFEYYKQYIADFFANELVRILKECTWHIPEGLENTKGIIKIPNWPSNAYTINLKNIKKKTK